MNTRRYELDYAKGIGALLVIFGHMTTYDRTIVRNVIYTFHMPMFFILAGMVFELRLQKSGRGGHHEFVKKKVRQILIPSLFLGIVWYLWMLVKNCIEHTYTGVQLVKHFAGIFIQINDSDYSGGLWFLTVIFESYIACFLLFRRKDSVWWVSRVGLIGYAVGYGYSIMLPGLYLPWFIQVLPMAVFYMCVGMLFYRVYEKLTANTRIILLVVCTGLTVFLCWLCVGVLKCGIAMDYNQYGHVLFSPLLAVTASICIVLICRMLPKSCRVLTYIGKNSMLYYGFQAIFVGIMDTLIWHVWGEDILYSWQGFIISIGSLAVIAAACAVCCFIYHRYIEAKLLKR